MLSSGLHQVIVLRLVDTAQPAGTPQEAADDFFGGLLVLRFSIFSLWKENLKDSTMVSSSMALGLALRSRAAAGVLLILSGASLNELAPVCLELFDGRPASSGVGVLSAAGSGSSGRLAPALAPSVSRWRLSPVPERVSELRLFLWLSRFSLVVAVS